MERNRNLFWKLLEPEHPKAEAFSRKLMGSREDGDDLYQDALVLALTKFSSLKETAAFRPWLYRIIVNCFKNRFRTPWYRKVIPLTEEISGTLRTADPSRGYAISRLLQKAMSGLSIEERSLVTLFEIEGWTIAELGRVYHAPEGTIKARLFRTRNKMKKALLEKKKNSNHASYKESVKKVTLKKVTFRKVKLKSAMHSPSDLTTDLTAAKQISSAPSTVSRTFSRMYHE